MKANTSGTFTSAAGAAETITLGYEPSYIKVVNVTTNVVYEFFNDGTNSMGIETAGATGVVTQASTGLALAGSYGFTVAAAGLSASDVVYYVAERLY